MSSSVSVNEQNYNKPSTGSYVGGVLAGSAIQISTNQFGGGLINLPIINKMTKIGSSLTEDEFSKVEQAIEETMKTSGLEEKGLSILGATENNVEEVSQIFRNEFDNNVIIKHLMPKKVKEEKHIQPAVEAIVKGKNAVFAFVDNKIILPGNKKLDIAFFHEAGHAMNAHMSTIGKMLKKGRAAALLGTPIFWVALFKDKKAPDEKPKNTLDKITTFIKDHAGILTSVLFIPTILEEGLATHKGNSFAKKLLSPDLAKKVKKLNGFGLATYIVTAIACGLGVHFGKKVRDSIVGN